MTLTVTAADEYMAERTGKYDYRKIRYTAALRAMQRRGLSDSDTVMDIGAGWTELDYCLRVDGDWRGRYIPIDAGIDGTDLEDWTPPRDVEYAVALELLEHLYDPAAVVRLLQESAQHIVVSVPNPRTVDVLAIDRTHVTVVTREMLQSWGFTVAERMFYGGAFSDGHPDGLFGVWDK